MRNKFQTTASIWLLLRQRGPSKKNRNRACPGFHSHLVICDSSGNIFFLIVCRLCTVLLLLLKGFSLKSTPSREKSFTSSDPSPFLVAFCSATRAIRIRFFCYTIPCERLSVETGLWARATSGAVLKPSSSTIGNGIIGRKASCQGD